MESLIKEAKSLLNNATEGKKVGNYKVGSKEILENNINEIEKKLQKTVLTYKDVEDLDTKLRIYINNFKNSIVQDVSMEKYIMSKIWIDDSKWVLKISENQLFYANFHEGLTYDIVAKNISSNRIDYTVNYYGEIHKISIYKNSNNSISISDPSAQYSAIANNYTVGSKSDVIQIAHNNQDYGCDEDYEEDRNFCITHYDNLSLDRYDISLQDVKKYYKYNRIN